MEPETVCDQAEAENSRTRATARAIFVDCMVSPFPANPLRFTGLQSIVYQKLPVTYRQCKKRGMASPLLFRRPQENYERPPTRPINARLPLIDAWIEFSILLTAPAPSRVRAPVDSRARNIQCPLKHGEDPRPIQAPYRSEAG